jgi:hypothetical protein
MSFGRLVRVGFAALVVSAVTMVGCSASSDEASTDSAASAQHGGGNDNGGGGGGGGGDSVSAHLGGHDGILAFLQTKVVPAELSDSLVAPAFSVIPLSESGGDIEECLANLLDHDLGGSSPHFGAQLSDGHECRSSMTEIHRGRDISDAQIDRFIMIVGEQATMAGVASSDIQEVAKVLERYRGGVRNK